MLYSEVRQHIKNGDLIAFKGKTLLSKLIKLVTHGDVTHVGVAYWLHNRLLILEAREGYGVSLRALSRCLPFYWVPTHIKWSKRHETLSIERLGLSYSFLDAARAGVGLNFKSKGDICSEYAANILRISNPKIPKSPHPQALINHHIHEGCEMYKIQGPKSGPFSMENKKMVPAHYQLANDMIGLKEYPGKSKDNPTIMEMFADLGHSWVKHDETPWCAAFVGAMLEEAGIKSTRKLNARSYLQWGQPIAKPKIGDVVIFKRGNKGWQGHVGFYAGETKYHIKVLGGNQSNAVNIRSYRKSKLLGFRRAKIAQPKITEPVLPPVERKPLKDSGTLKGVFTSISAILLALVNQFSELNPITQTLLLLAIAGAGFAAWRRFDANRRGKIG